MLCLFMGSATGQIPINCGQMKVDSSIIIDECSINLSIDIQLEPARESGFTMDVCSGLGGGPFKTTPTSWALAEWVLFRDTPSDQAVWSMTVSNLTNGR